MGERKKSKRSSIKLENSEVSRVIQESSEGEHTLQEIGDMFDITRMRVCQIEKASLKKLASLENLKKFS
jgi:DNA-directed RNA polymerase sigma subunit (sigma70/sigma32)